MANYRAGRGNKESQIPVRTDTIYTGGHSNMAQCHKRVRETYLNVDIHFVRKKARELRLVSRSTNSGHDQLFVKRGTKRDDPNGYKGCFLCYDGSVIGNDKHSSMEIWYDAQPCTREEADRFYDQNMKRGSTKLTIHSYQELVK